MINRYIHLTNYATKYEKKEDADKEEGNKWYFKENNIELILVGIK